MMCPKLKIKGNYANQELGFKFVFGPMIMNEYAHQMLSPMLEKEHGLLFTTDLNPQILEDWRSHLHEGLDEFFEIIKKTIKEGVRWEADNVS